MYVNDGQGDEQNWTRYARRSMAEILLPPYRHNGRMGILWTEFIVYGSRFEEPQSQLWRPYTQ